MKVLLFLVSIISFKAAAVTAQDILEPCRVNSDCTSVSCRANLLGGNITASTQQLTAIFSVDPNCQQATDIFFGLRDTNGLSLFNQSFVDCFSILQQEQLEVTFGPLPSNTEDISFSLTQQTNETSRLTLWVPGEPNPPLLQFQTTWYHQPEQCPDPTTPPPVTVTVTTQRGGASSHISKFSLWTSLFTLVYLFYADSCIVNNM